MLRGLRFFELFRRSRRFEERLSALQASFDENERQSGGTQQATPGQHHADDARTELLIGLTDELDEMRKSSRARRWSAIFGGAAGIFMFLNAPDLLQGVVFGGILLVIALGAGWVELRRLKRVRILQRLIGRES